MKKFLCLIFAVFSIFSIFTISKINLSATTNNNLKYDCKSFVLVDYNSGKVLAQNNKDEKLQVASMVKLMTTLLTMEKIEKGEWSLDTKLLTSQYAASMEGSQAFLDAGQEYSIDDLLKSVIVASANDSCVVLAEAYAGSEKNFVEIMNKKAKELGMNNTYYENSTGLPSPNEYSCANDIAIILKEVCKHYLYHKYATIWMDTLTHKSGRKTELVNTNRLVKYYNGCDCGKTGFTDEAGYCLSSSAQRNNLRLISVVIGCKTSQARFEISSNLLNYGFANFESKKLISSDSCYNIMQKLKSGKEKIETFAEEDVFVTTARNKNESYEIKTEINNGIKLPLKQGSVVGKIMIVEDGVVIKEVNLIVKKDYTKQTYFNIVNNIIENWAV